MDEPVKFYLPFKGITDWYVFKDVNGSDYVLNFREIVAVKFSMNTDSTEPTKLIVSSGHWITLPKEANDNELFSLLAQIHKTR